MMDGGIYEYGGRTYYGSGREVNPREVGMEGERYQAHCRICGERAEGSTPDEAVRRANEHEREKHGELKAETYEPPRTRP